MGPEMKAVYVLGTALMVRMAELIPKHPNRRQKAAVPQQDTAQPRAAAASSSISSKKDKKDKKNRKR